MYCRKCGKEMPDTAKFCAACGAPAGRGRQAEVMQTPAGSVRNRRKNPGWIVGIGAAVLVLAVAAGFLILGMPKKTGFVVKLGVGAGVRGRGEYGELCERRFYYKDGKLVTGWFDVDGKQYYAAEKKKPIYNGDKYKVNAELPDWYEYGQLYENGVYVIDGRRYTFDEKGECIGQTKVLKTEEQYFNNVLRWMWSYNDAGNLTESVGFYCARCSYSYDTNGKLTRVEDYGEDGDLQGYATYSYDTNGNQVKYERYEDGERRMYIYDYYDKKGTLKKTEVESDYDGLIKEMFYCNDRWNVTQTERWGDGDSQRAEYSYDNNGNLVKGRMYYANGRCASGEWDEKGNPTKEEWYDDNGNLTEYTKRSYDDEGNLIKEERGSREWDHGYYDNGISVGYTRYTNYSYDEKGNLTKEEYYYEDGNRNRTWYTNYDYDEKGNLTKKEQYDENGNRTEYINSNYSYDDKDNLIREEHYNDGLLSDVSIYDSDGDIIRYEDYWEGVLESYTIYTYY